MKTVQLYTPARTVALTALLFTGLCQAAVAKKEDDKVWEEKDGIVIIEAEENGSHLGKWEKKKELFVEFCGDKVRLKKFQTGLTGSTGFLSSSCP